MDFNLWEVGRKVVVGISYLKELWSWGSWEKKGFRLGRGIEW